ncbi:hypothetical protein K493DRAFT_306188 [Basidiobolus meristosporus CBS 931.73]|uniref:Uncharacterized protein n=1 Tax=Basidiobolus meristosporus CBS 931.73 TaxID=1314790 RepID=A0A1Y1XTZ1_9FUNG|nr:hypothetical protein K493DRAFT_306188 [Basidiobolus meristosporus CBS 931.73]|eukprot:ORX88956.1 hypothetical protein K493DRAFT_306188 [Basidiobolus meristosporus CBS 931.73]
MKVELIQRLIQIFCFLRRDDDACKYNKQVVKKELSLPKSCILRKGKHYRVDPKRGGVVLAVCHGPAIPPGIMDSRTGKSIIAGKNVTGFSTKSGEMLNLLELIKSANVAAIEKGAVAVGADHCIALFTLIMKALQIAIPVLVTTLALNI